MIAFYIGTKANADICFYCYTTVAVVASFISIAHSPVIIPRPLRMSMHEGKAQAEQFLKVLISGYTLITEKKENDNAANICIRSKSD